MSGDEATLGRRMLRRALLVSLLLHLTLLFGPHLDLPGVFEPTLPEPITARLLPPPPPAVAPPAPPPPKPPVAPRTKPTRPAPAVIAQPAVTEAAPAVLAPVPAAEAPPAPGQEAPPAPAPEASVHAPAGPAVDSARGQRLPHRGRLRFDVVWGWQEMVVGEAIHTWRIDGAGYQLDATMATTGLAAWLRGVRVAQRSSGAYGAEAGFTPRDYRVERGDNAQRTETVRFDTASGQVEFGADARREPAPAGAQDLLSFLYQLGALVGPGMQAGESFSLPVATGRKLETYILDVVGEAAVSTGIGPRRVYHLRVRHGGGGERTEVWIAQDELRLPVRIVHADRGGQLFDLRIVDMELDDANSQTR